MRLAAAYEPAAPAPPLQGSSFGWQCSSSNCYSVPLGFIGQAAIIAAIILVLATVRGRGRLGVLLRGVGSEARCD